MNTPSLISGDRRLGAYALAAGLAAAVLPWLAVAITGKGATSALDPALILALLTLAWHFWRHRRVSLASSAIWPLGASFLCAATPFQQGSALALVILAWIAAIHANAALRATAALILALSLVMALDNGLRQSLTHLVLEYEAGMVFRIAQALDLAIGRNGNLLELADGRKLLVLPACSVIAFVDRTLLMAVACAILLDLRPRLLLSSLVLAFLAVILNSLRLTAMASSDAVYDFLHDGFGSDLFAITVIALGPLIMLVFHQPSTRLTVRHA